MPTGCYERTEKQKEILRYWAKQPKPWQRTIEEKTCPVCGKKFKPESSKVKHCSRECATKNRPKKGEYIECQTCGKEFYVMPSKVDTRKYCSRECQYKGQEKEKVELICDGCGKKYKVLSSTAKRNGIRGHNKHFCSKDCQHKNCQKERIKKDIIVKCGNCGEKFKVRPNKYRDRLKRSKYNVLFCSVKCRDDWYTGKNHPNWIKDRSKIKEKRNIKGHKKYESWRQKVFRRDNYTCLLCGERGGRLRAHHIKKWNDYPELRFERNNGITLCYECHQLTKGIEEEIEGNLRAKLEEWESK